MKKKILFASFTLLALACKPTNQVVENRPPSDFVIAFGSCNKHTFENRLWDDVLAAKPNVWIWGGDNIYADTLDVGAIRSMYEEQNNIPGYHELREQVAVIGTWDDHDYGINDGGLEFPVKKESQLALFDFLGVPGNSERRQREGVYALHRYDLPNGKVNIFVLDTRYFRTSLRPDEDPDRRYQPNEYGEGTILGEAQWDWLSKELQASEADFNLLVSSVQFLSKEHGFEGWKNFPHEVDRLERLIAVSEAKGVIILSGDRHISEFSRKTSNELLYPLVDFTSSGLTHAYSEFSGEANQYRTGSVVATESFGLIFLDLKSKTALMQMIGDNGEVLGELVQRY